jgi:hypothetical protein
MNSKEKGDVVVGKAIGYFMGKNIQVCLPIGDKRPYDLVIEDENHQLKKVQCKFAGAKSPCGIYVASLRVCGGNQSYHTAKHYQKGDFDWLFTMTAEGTCYMIPAATTDGLRSTINLGKECEQFKVGIV